MSNAAWINKLIPTEEEGEMHHGFLKMYTFKIKIPEDGT